MKLAGVKKIAWWKYGTVEQKRF